MRDLIIYYLPKTDNTIHHHLLRICERETKAKINSFFCLPNVTYTLSIVGPKGSKHLLDNHSEDCSSSASNQKLDMELFAAIVFSCSIISSLCSVPSAASDQRKDIIEGINTVSEKLVTRNLFGQL